MTRSQWWNEAAARGLGKCWSRQTTGYLRLDVGLTRSREGSGGDLSGELSVGAGRLRVDCGWMWD
ncbi:MAG: hypothetical protein K5930_02275 [Treponemataceae bacterium]|nr:hypothetical protein [Treponemataceae bacterium]